MSLTIKLYKTSSPYNQITKTLSNELSLTGTYKDNISILEPEVLISTSTNINQYNYMYIADNERYYFIDIDIVRDGLYRIKGSVDVLYSHKAEILNNKAVVKRQANQYNLYLNDDIFKVYNKTNVITKNFPYGFDRNGSYILTVLGG